ADRAKAGEGLLPEPGYRHPGSAPEKNVKVSLHSAPRGSVLVIHGPVQPPCLRKGRPLLAQRPLAQRWLHPTTGTHRPVVLASWPRAGGARPRLQRQLSLPLHQARVSGGPAVVPEQAAEALPADRLPAARVWGPEAPGGRLSRT